LGQARDPSTLLRAGFHRLLKTLSEESRGQTECSGRADLQVRVKVLNRVVIPSVAEGPLPPLRFTWG